MNGFLTSTATPKVWLPGEPMTGDTRPPLQTGVYAFKSLASAIEHSLGLPNHVFGEVSLWGEIIEHEKGYRAEFAAIKSLDGIMSGDKEALEELRKFYGVSGRDDLTPPRIAPQYEYEKAPRTKLNYFLLGAGTVIAIAAIILANRL